MGKSDAGAELIYTGVQFMEWSIGDRVEQRVAYGEALIELGQERDDIIVLDADLQRSNKTYGFGQKFPDRFFDMGIAEADMISTAAGMASMGFVVFANTFAMFLPGRCYDQIRLQVAYAESNVKLVGASAGITMGPDGASHQSLDDVALMRQLPHVTVIVPADATETIQAVHKAAEINGPVYIRISRYPTPVIYDGNYRYQLGVPNLVHEGDDLIIFATGIMVDKGVQAAVLLKEKGISTAVVNVSTIKPLDRQRIQALFSGKKFVITLEDHSIIGGLGSAIAELVAETISSPPLVRLGLNDCFGQSGNADDLLDFYGLTPTKIAKSITESLNRIIGLGSASKYS
jgi:transketolase